MRLHSIQVDNFIGPWNGMGLTTLYIDFSKCKNRITVIKSDNGAGKSSFLRIVTPLPDNFRDLISGVQARKIISYLLNDGSILVITYVYPVNKNGERAGSKCSITRTFPGQPEIELNPNGNITTGKDIIFELFGIDDSFGLLSYISATQKGLGALIPSQRKAFIKSALSTVDYYIGLYKTLTKKHTILKSLLNSITTKISQIGNIESIQDTLKKQTLELKALEARKEELLGSTNAMKAEMELISQNRDLTKELSDALSQYSVLENELSNLPQIMEYSEEKIQEVTVNIASKQGKLEAFNSRLQELVDEELKYTQEQQSIQIKLDSFSDESVIQTLKQRLEEIQSKLKFYEKKFIEIGFKAYESITENDYKAAIEAIEFINESIYGLSKFGENARKKGIEYLERRYVPTDYQSLIDQLQVSLDKLRSILREQEILKNNTADYEKIPKDCKHTTTCPFITTLVQNHSKLMNQSQLDDTHRQIDRYLARIEELKHQLTEQAEIIECISSTQHLYKYIISIRSLIGRFPNTEFIFKKEEIVFHIENTLPIELDLDKYIEYSNFITIISGLKQDGESISKQLDEYNNSNKERVVLQERMDNLVKTLNGLTGKKLALLGEINKYKNEILVLQDTLNQLQLTKINKQKYDKYTSELESTDKTIKELSVTVEKYTKLAQSYSKDQASLNEITHNNIPSLTSSIENCKYRLVMFDQYKKDLDQYTEIFEREEVLRKYASTNGIQTVYMAVFMNSILNKTNKLLQMLFGGKFRLEPFVINENEFAIPCVDTEGNLRSDISLMSDSQLSMISMILSFVIFHEASKNYNIIKLDEVDDNLDNSNRLQFSQLINQLMTTLQYDQCLIISHNDEIDLTNTDMILFKIENSGHRAALLNSGANVIYAY